MSIRSYFQNIRKYNTGGTIYLGEKNNAMCNYLSAPEVFADFINGAVFEGRKEVCAEILKESNSVLYDISTKKIHLPAGKNTISRSRDVVKYLAGEKEYLIIGIENQNDIHYAMPLRCMEYDVMEYKKQMKLITDSNKKEKKLASDSYLSGFGPNDRLFPVVTLVFYHGKITYNGCKSLHEMLELNYQNKAYLPLISDYKLNLISISELDENIFKTGLRDLIGIMKHSNSKKDLQDYVQNNKDRMKHLDETTFDTISVMINHKDLNKYKVECSNEEGGIDMCQAIIEMIEEGRSEGIEVGRSEGIEVGRSEGLEVGRSEGMEKIIMVMLSKGYDRMLISKMTDVSIEIINKWAGKSEK